MYSVKIHLFPPSIVSAYNLQPDLAELDVVGRRQEPQRRGRLIWRHSHFVTFNTISLPPVMTITVCLFHSTFD